jgi:hypothetical protein
MIGLFWKIDPPLALSARDSVYTLSNKLSLDRQTVRGGAPEAKRVCDGIIDFLIG